MKKGKVLNEHISKAIASMGHGDMFVIADAGLAIPKNVEKIDVSVGVNLPGFLDTLKVIIEELFTDRVIVPSQMIEKNRPLYDEIKNLVLMKVLKKNYMVVVLLYQ